MSMSRNKVRLLFTGLALLLITIQFVPMFAGAYRYEISFLALHVAIILVLVYLLVPFNGERERNGGTPWYDVLLALLSLLLGLYVVSQGQRIVERIEGVDPVFTTDIVAGIALIALLLEACRRVSGNALTLIAGLFILYAFGGPYLPGPLEHRGVTLFRFVDSQILSTSGIFGQPVSASANMVFYFVLVGAFLQKSGAGQLFTDFAQLVTARARGGSGKAAVVSSGLFGMISGSAVSNVLVSGLITIPLMKKTGFSGRMSGAIEATASTGSQLAPPIMGAVAFILADVVGVSYSTVILAAIVPALLYYLSVFMFVHFYSARYDIRSDTSVDLAEFGKSVRQRGHLMLALGVMIGLLYVQYSVMFVGFFTLVSILLLATFRRQTRLHGGDLLEGVRSAVRAVLEVTIPCAVAGLIVAIIIQTGIGFKIQASVIESANQWMILALFGAMFMTIIFGMGMPTVAAYMISGILVAPSLQEFGIPAINAHMFILYFSVLSMVTPPVALASYAAAGISGARLWGTGTTAFLLALPGFIIPYAFVFRPEMLLQDGLLAAAVPLALATLGVVSIAAGTGGFFLRRIDGVTRILFFVFGICLVSPDSRLDTIGLIGVACLALYVGVRGEGCVSRNRSRRINS